MSDQMNDTTKVVNTNEKSAESNIYLRDEMECTNCRVQSTENDKEEK